jgi:2-oxoglutarate ferredoxin oxidoreductase subunit delta
MIEADPPSAPVRARSNWVEINRAWCKSCAVCAAFCPTNALTCDEVGTPYLTSSEKCTGCGLCELMCPDFAIEVIKQR